MARKKRKKSKEKVAAEPKRITPVDIQQREFRVAMRGYHEQDVDQFLDQVTEEVARLYAENKRLREELEFVRTTRVDVGGAAEVEAMLRRASDEADRILAEARTRAMAVEQGAGSDQPTPMGSSASLGPFISREREFLQSLAHLIQSHAESVKHELRRARQVAAGEPSAPAGGSGPARPSPEDGPTQALTVMETGVEAGPPVAEMRLERGGADAQGRMVDPDMGDQDWTQYYVGPTVGSGGRGKSGSVRQDEIVDLTRAHDAGRAPRSDEDARSSSSPQADLPDEDEEEDRSLRELFWGED